MLDLELLQRGLCSLLSALRPLRQHRDLVGQRHRRILYERRLTFGAPGRLLQTRHLLPQRFDLGGRVELGRLHELLQLVALLDQRQALFLVGQLDGVELGRVVGRLHELLQLVALLEQRRPLLLVGRLQGAELVGGVGLDLVNEDVEILLGRLDVLLLHRSDWRRRRRRRRLLVLCHHRRRLLGLSRLLGLPPLLRRLLRSLRRLPSLLSPLVLGLEFQDLGLLRLDLLHERVHLVLVLVPPIDRSVGPRVVALTSLTLISRRCGRRHAPFASRRQLGLLLPPLLGGLPRLPRLWLLHVPLWVLRSRPRGSTQLSDHPGTRKQTPRAQRLQQRVVTRPRPLLFPSVLLSFRPPHRLEKLLIQQPPTRRPRAHKHQRRDNIRALVVLVDLAVVAVVAVVTAIGAAVAVAVHHQPRRPPLPGAGPLLRRRALHRPKQVSEERKPLPLPALALALTLPASLSVGVLVSERHGPPRRRRRGRRPLLPRIPLLLRRRRIHRRNRLHRLTQVTGDAHVHRRRQRRLLPVPTYRLVLQDHVLDGLLPLVRLHVARSVRARPVCGGTVGRVVRDLSRVVSSPRPPAPAHLITVFNVVVHSRARVPRGRVWRRVEMALHLQSTVKFEKLTVGGIVCCLAHPRRPRSALYEVWYEQVEKLV